jgi:glyoxylase-like metal-dependent hydrolase (beta-lactamase superfamily II)
MIRRPIHMSSIFASLIFTVGCGSTQLSPNSNSDLISSFSGPGAERSIVRITDDIYRAFDNTHSSLFVVTDEGIVFIDPLNLPAAEWFAQEIETNFDQPVTHILYSHGHHDHASGAAAFGDVEIISHVKTLSMINPSVDQALARGYQNYDNNGNGVIQRTEADAELLEVFDQIDSNGNNVLTGQETEGYFHRNIVPPTQTYDSEINRMRIGGKLFEMHFVGGNHAADMSYIFLPEESIVFYVDVISLRALPFGPLAWYSKEDSENTYAEALSIGADIAIPSHGPIGTQEDVRDLESYMSDLRERVMRLMDEGLSLEEIQSTIDMREYADFDYFEDRLPQNVMGMHRTLIAERAAQ